MLPIGPYGRVHYIVQADQLHEIVTLTNPNNGQRERVLAGKAPVDSLPGWWTRLRHFAADLVNNVAHQPETDANFGEAVRAGAPLDDKLHLFGTARLQPLQECACRQDPTIEP